MQEQTIEPGIVSSDPLPGAFVTDTPGIGGVVKVRPEDFLVEEFPLYEPCGEGEHLYLRVEKIRVSHNELITSLSRHFHVPARAIGFAGMKDKIGVTRQTVSIHLPRNDEEYGEIRHERIGILWATRHTNKLRRGHLKGNRFVIRIRDVDPTQAPTALKTLRILQRIGVPNYFGIQRFGYRQNNHLLGAHLLLNEFDALISELLGSTGSTFPEYQQQRRKNFDDGQFEEAHLEWGTADNAELAALNALKRGENARQAVRAIPRTARNFWVCALQSAIFNHVLNDRIRNQRLNTLLEGDIACKHINRAMFPVTADELVSDNLPKRLEAMEISPTGPLWGPGMMQAEGDIASVEIQALKNVGLSKELFTQSTDGLEGERRPLRTQLNNVDLDGGADEHGVYVRVAFDLPRGAYATVVLREIMKVDDRTLAGPRAVASLS